MFESKIENCAAGKKDTRPAMQGVYLDSEHNRAVASDGHCLASIECDVDYTGILPVEAVKHSRKRGAFLTIHAENTTVSEGDRETTYPYTPGPFPTYQAVIPSKSTKTVCFNAELLARVQAAICGTKGKQGIILHIPDSDGGAMLVESAYAADGTNVGVVMPMRKDR